MNPLFFCGLLLCPTLLLAQTTNFKDSDRDGWLDEGNIQYRLILDRIKCIHPSEIGHDELYLNVEDIRFPLSSTLDSFWSMAKATVIEPHCVIEERTYVPTMPKSNFKTRIALREADVAIIENPTDDFLKNIILDWGDKTTYYLEIKQPNCHYELFFKMDSVFFKDPSPLDLNGDADHDKIPDEREFKIAHQKAVDWRCTIVAVEGYNGLASPLAKDLFIEVDAIGEADKMSFDAKQQVASQLYFHHIHPRLDDGYLKGGEILPYYPVVTFHDMVENYYPKMDKDRNRYYKYALFVPDMGGLNGMAAGNYLVVSRATMWGSFSAITFLHELGHTFGLRHPKGKKKGINEDHPCETCPIPADWKGTHNYCGVGDEDVTAMGNDIGTIDIVLGAILGLLAGLGGCFFAKSRLKYPLWMGISVVLLAIFLGGSIGFIYSDAGQRVVDFHPNEWKAVRL
jgi:hypothetical protein